LTVLATERKFSASPHNQALGSTLLLHREVLAFADLGMEAIYEFDVVDMPVTVAVDAAGTSVHNTGPAEWQTRIATGEFKGIAVSAG
jgi:fumarate hydratase, class I